MNPVPVMELVELIRGIATDDATFNTARIFVQKLGKQIAVRRLSAFIVNRILLPMINERSIRFTRVSAPRAIDAR